MPWTQEHQNVLGRFAAKFPLQRDENASREWTRHAAEQFRFSFPTEQWGHKQASSSRPPSTDVIATRSPFIGYDLIVDQGLPSQTLAHMPGPIDLTGQSFIEVDPIDHVGESSGPVVPPPDDDVIEQIARDVARIRQLLENAARRFGLA